MVSEFTSNETFKQTFIHFLKIESTNVLDIEERVKRKRVIGDALQ